MTNTKHGQKRLKERTGNSKKNDRLLKLAIERGLRHKDTKNRLNKYLTKQFLKYKTATQMRVYQDEVFMFSKEFELITVIDLPRNLRKHAYNTNRKDDKEVVVNEENNSVATNSNYGI